MQLNDPPFLPAMPTRAHAAFAGARPAVKLILLLLCLPYLSSSTAPQRTQGGRLPLQAIQHSYDLIDLDFSSLKSSEQQQQQQQQQQQHITRLDNRKCKNGHPLHRSSLSVRLPAAVRAKLPALEAELSLNTALFSASYQLKDGDEVVRTGAENCYYHGQLTSSPSSLVVASTCEGGLDAVVFLDDDTLVVEPLSARPDLHELHADKVSASTHVVYRMSEALLKPEFGIRPPEKCGVGADGKVQAGFSSPLLAPIKTGLRRKLLQQTHYIELYVVNDQRQVQLQGGSSDAETHSNNLINGVAGLYSKLTDSNVVVTIGTTENWSSSSSQIRVSGDTVDEDTDISLYLPSFRSFYRSMTDRPDNAQLISGWDMSGGTAGIAYVGAMCGSSSVGVNEDSSGSRIFTMETITHEMGHNLGSRHDSDGNTCNARGNIMAAIGSVSFGEESTLDWSTCSESYISDYISGLSNNCLLDVPESAAEESSTGGGGAGATGIGLAVLFGLLLIVLVVAVIVARVRPDLVQKCTKWNLTIGGDSGGSKKQQGTLKKQGSKKKKKQKKPPSLAALAKRAETQPSVVWSKRRAQANPRVPGAGVSGSVLARARMFDGGAEGQRAAPQYTANPMAGGEPDVPEVVPEVPVRPPRAVPMPPLPPFWQQLWDEESNQPYYYNSRTRQSVWEIPQS